MRSGHAKAIGTVCGTLLLGFLTAVAWAQNRPQAGIVIVHKGFQVPQRRGSALLIEATITSPAGVRKAEVFCRPLGGREFTALPMSPLDDAETYRAVVPDWLTAGEGLEYYISATDQLGRSASHGFVGFPLVVHLVTTRLPTREERLKALEQTLDVIRKQRDAAGSGVADDPLLNRPR